MSQAAIENVIYRQMVRDLSKRHWTLGNVTASAKAALKTL